MSFKFPPAFKTVYVQIQVFIALLIGLEFLAFSYNAFRYGFRTSLSKHPIVEGVSILIQSEPNLPSGAIGISGFSPITQTRYEPYSKFGLLSVNGCGFIANQSLIDPNADNCFDDLLKEDSEDSKIFKIFLLGGSSMAGTGVDSNEKTIAALLQKKFLETHPNLNVKVYNFGAGGSYTFRQSQLMLSELINYKPNVIVSFDGFNDAHDWALEGRRKFANGRKLLISKHLEDGIGIPNWTGISYRNFLLKSGYKLGYESDSYFFTYLSRTIKEIANTNRLNSGVWNRSAEYSIGRKISRDPSTAAKYFYNNVASMATIATVASSGNSCFVQIVQGDAHHKKNKSQSELDALSSYHRIFSKNHGSELTSDHYIRVMHPLINAYVDALKDDVYDLDNVLGGNFSWADFRGLMDAKAAYVSSYVGIIHTNELGNRIISDAMYSEIKSTNCLHQYSDFSS